MKLKAIATIFKRNKSLKILTMPNGAQWITNGIAMYSMSGMPKLTPAMVLKIFDIPDDKQSEWTCEVKPMPENMCEMCTSGFYTTESLLEPKKSTIEYGGVTYSLLSNAVIMPIMLGEEMAKELLDIGRYYNSVRYKFISENIRKTVIQTIPINPETGEILDEGSEYTQETL